MFLSLSLYGISHIYFSFHPYFPPKQLWLDTVFTLSLIVSPVPVTELSRQDLADWMVRWKKERMNERTWKYWAKNIVMVWVFSIFQLWIG